MNQDQTEDKQAPPGDGPTVMAEAKINTERTDIDDMTDAVDEFSRSIDTNLRAFRGQFARLSDAILEHTEKVRRGEFEDAEIGAIFKRFDPVLNLSIQQETKLNDKLAERVGKAGKFALDFDEAKSEIWGRLTRLRAAGAVGRVPEGDAG
jgi:hypothetical protein